MQKKKNNNDKIVFSLEKSKLSTKPTILKSLEKERISKKNMKKIFEGKKTIYLQKQIGKHIFKSVPSSDELFNSNSSYIFNKKYIISKRKHPKKNYKKKKSSCKKKKKYDLVNPFLISKMENLKEKIVNLINK